MTATAQLNSFPMKPEDSKSTSSSSTDRVESATCSSLHLCTSLTNDCTNFGTSRACFLISGSCIRSCIRAPISSFPACFARRAALNAEFFQTGAVKSVIFQGFIPATLMISSMSPSVFSTSSSALSESLSIRLISGIGYSESETEPSFPAASHNSSQICGVNGAISRIQTLAISFRDAVPPLRWYHLRSFISR